jgi:hypothetical protein
MAFLLAFRDYGKPPRPKDLAKQRRPCCETLNSQRPGSRSPSASAFCSAAPVEADAPRDGSLAGRRGPDRDGTERVVPLRLALGQATRPTGRAAWRPECGLRTRGRVFPDRRRRRYGQAPPRADTTLRGRGAYLPVGPGRDRHVVGRGRDAGARRGVPGVTEQNRTILPKTLGIEVVAERRQTRGWPKSLDFCHPLVETEKPQNRWEFAGSGTRGFWPGAGSTFLVPLLLDARRRDSRTSPPPLDRARRAYPPDGHSGAGV